MRNQYLEIRITVNRLTKCEHHPTIASQTKQAAMPDTDDDQCEQHDSSIVTKDVDQDL